MSVCWYIYVSVGTEYISNFHFVQAFEVFMCWQLMVSHKKKEWIERKMLTLRLGVAMAIS